MQDNILYYVITGFIQGLTEFIPISSSGHILLLQKLFNLNEPFLLLDAVLHFGTLIAVIFFFRKRVISILIGFLKKPFEINNSDTKFVVYIILMNIPTVIIALVLKMFFKGLDNIVLLPFFFLTTAGLIFLMDRIDGNKEIISVSIPLILFVGLLQGIAVIPGISRSGITVTALILFGIKRNEAVFFSLVGSLPAIFGGTLFELVTDFNIGDSFIPGILIGFIISLFSGIIFIGIFKKLVQIKRMYIFSIYLVILSIIIFVFIK